MISNSKTKLIIHNYPKFDLSDDNLEDLYTWVDSVPLSRTKKNFARDFSDAVCCAEVLCFFMPKEVDMIYYIPSCCSTQKKLNWKILNDKVFSKLGIKLSEDTIALLVDSKPGVIEQVIWDIRTKLPNSDPTKVKPKPKRQGLPNFFSKNIRPTSSTPCQLKAMKVNEVLEFPDENSNYIIDNTEPIIVKPKRNIKKTIVSSSTTAFTKNGVVEALKRKCSGQGKSKSVERTIASRGKSVPYKTIPNPPRKINPIAIIPEDQPIVNYRGIKMIPVALLEDKEVERQNLEVENKKMESKLNRLMRLLMVKEHRAEDLTNQLHELHNLYGRDSSRPDTQESIFADEPIAQ